MEEIFRESFERSRKHEKMFDASWDNGTNQPRSREMLMDLDDLDLDASWPLDQMPFMSEPIMSPFVVSSSEQPCSPLWEFSGAGGAAAEDEKLPHVLRYPEYPLFLTCTSRSVAENMTESDNADSYWLIKERMTQALRSFKESTGEHVLAQVWAPVRKGGRYVLTTLGQPFVIDPHSNGLNQYRMVSLAYMFSVDSESDYELGLPGRVFRQKLPEWTPNVQYYSSKEFSRLDHALLYNVRGTLALPVFGPSGQSCIAVVELIMTSEKIHYAPEVDKVCRALKAVDLKSSEILDHQTTTQICNESRQNALAEILEILTVVCETHKLPLAQTWVPCMHRSVLAYGGGLRKSCTSFDGSCMGKVCMSTTDVASYVVDAHVWGFRDACLEHHLQKGQGVAGRAFLNRNSCFCRDITRFSKTEYPLVHYARMFKLTGCFAICLQSSYTDADDYVLEFFLPSYLTDRTQQNSLLGSLLATIKQHLQSLRVASGLELGVNEVSVEIFEASEDKDIDLRTESFQIPNCEKSPPRLNSSPNVLGFQRNSPEKQLMLEPDTVNIKERTNCGNTVAQNNASACLTEVKEAKKPERKRGKTEKTVSMEILQQYFAGSLKDAAKSLGVCPTTMKRICRQHGIARWPSRKINKVNRSLTKLKRVIESVRGADGAIDLTSLTPSPLPVAVGSISWSANPNGVHQLSSPNGLKSQEPLVPEDNSPDGGLPTTNPTIRVDEQSMCGNLFSQEHESTRSKADSGSREEKAASPASYDSCEAKPPKEANASIQGGGFMVDESHDLTIRLPLLAAPTEVPELIVLEDARRSKDLGLLSPMMFQVKFPDPSSVNPASNNHAGVPPKEFMDVTQSTPRVPSKPEMKTITIKANYRDDIVRFRVSPSSGIMELKEEVAKRLKLEVGTFDIKYLDDDQEWVLIACDADLQECLDISISAGSNVARLSVHDVMANLGSSCESTGELC